MLTCEEKLRKYCSNFQDIENYEEAVQSTERYDLHHRKEVETLDDGSVVLRSMKELKELGLYFHRSAEELIFLKHTEHMSLHNKGKKRSAETRSKISKGMKGKFIGDKSPLYGKKCSTETRAKMSEAHRGEKCYKWKGDDVGIQGKYIRAKKLFKKGLISEEEFQTYRDRLSEYRRFSRKKKAMIKNIIEKFH